MTTNQMIKIFAEIRKNVKTQKPDAKTQKQIDDIISLIKK